MNKPTFTERLERLERTVDRLEEAVNHNYPRQTIIIKKCDCGEKQQSTCDNCGIVFEAGGCCDKCNTDELLREGKNGC